MQILIRVLSGPWKPLPCGSEDETGSHLENQPDNEDEPGIELKINVVALGLGHH